MIIILLSYSLGLIIGYYISKYIDPIKIDNKFVPKAFIPANRKKEEYYNNFKNYERRT